MTSTNPTDPAPHTGRPDTSTDAAAIARQEADVWRHLTHALRVEVRRRLIPLIRANL
jgi:hypothetical protein